MDGASGVLRNFSYRPAPLTDEDNQEAEAGEPPGFPAETPPI